MLLRHRRICWDCCGLLVSSGNIIDSDRSDGDDGDDNDADDNDDDNDDDDNDDSDDSDDGDGDGDDNDDSDDTDGDDSDRDSTKQLIASLSSSHLYISAISLSVLDDSLRVLLVEGHLEDATRTTR